MSVLSLVICCLMLIGTTFAWFTDSASTGINNIIAGNLDMELLHSNGVVKDEYVNRKYKAFCKFERRGNALGAGRRLL